MVVQAPNSQDCGDGSRSLNGFALRQGSDFLGDAIETKEEVSNSACIDQEWSTSFTGTTNIQFSQIRSVFEFARKRFELRSNCRNVM